ncbi:nicotinic acid mononucleotide adenylyltransferase [Sedimentibacter acidaminivorans]|uniref:nicotinate-nucleotide adenylyltransferase n=1 Tax=Sedimentibacter acidaminivorans TaxID=913099 RepID=A0ABS4GEL7_9FIRM|nr:cytidyltransferase [Sedimentibacter acidaminivorans]MBP1926140.1 nicotinic acid mononucleotide adenylyltransferase [Sedimentibacter acidaminivorans]
MNRLMLNELHKEILESLTEKEFLKRVNVTEEKIQSFIINKDFVNNLLNLISKSEIKCKDVLDLSLHILTTLCKEPPKDWLNYIFQYTLYKSFPGSVSIRLYPKYEDATLIYLEILRTILRHEQNHKGFDKFSNFSFLTEKEKDNLKNPSEYIKFIEVFNKSYVYEMMKLDEEVNGYNTLEHTAAVHYVAMHVGRQLYKVGIPVDLGLVSGSSAGHDIGKYGCKNDEKKRVAYLHYYYTDLWFMKHDMPGIAHIAANHSTWDLELETLPLESLILIYADFRVKNKTNKSGNKMSIFSLADSFQIILDKLDNVDDAKEKRYIRVYEKLKDFENYMIHRGISIDLANDEPGIHKDKDFALINGNEVIENYKYMAIGHNTSLMSKLNNEVSFASMIEAARSEKNWKNIRAYLNIFEEYSTYLTRKQKIFTLSFLYELLINREGDIRRQAANLIGKIIVSFDMEYKKEMPSDVKIILDDEVSGLKLWEKYLDLFIRPDHKITDQHKEWIGYSLRIFVDSVISGCNNKDKKNYLRVFLIYFEGEQTDPVAILNQLNSLLSIPMKICEKEQINTLVDFAIKSLENQIQEIRLMAVQFLYYLTKQKTEVIIPLEKIIKFIESFSKEEEICINYLKYKMSMSLNLPIKVTNLYQKLINEEKNKTSDLFLNNLKAATPWNVKTISIDFIMDNVENSNEVTLLHTATHLCNLVKVSAKESVRNKAGNSLLEIGPLLSIDQRNEIAIELIKGLEIDELQFAKYIPEYLGKFVLLLHPKELDEVIFDIKNIYKSSNERVSSLALTTFGVIVQHYPEYKGKFIESEEEYNSRLIKILGIILSGLANYNVQVKQESFLIIGQHIFGSKKLNLKQKHVVFMHVYKKLLTLINEKEISDLFFFNNSASFNHIYRFISDYMFYYKDFEIKENRNIAFFPGTFDPFSLSHKGIVTEIRNMGFEVFLAVDEFSWSKRVQPRMIRRQIINMSIADELNVYLFSDDVPVNLSNVDDLKRLKSSFPDKDVYIVVGSDVVINASAYKQRAVKHSIHSFNHIVFNRVSSHESADEFKKLGETKNRIKGSLVELKLPLYLEDISSTQIRENIDNNRDISNLIDPLAQSFIYDKNIYLREPQYKSIIRSKPLRIEIIEDLSKKIVDEIGHYIFMHTDLYENIGEQLISKNMTLMVVRDGRNSNKLLGFSAFHKISTSEVYTEFKSQPIANFVREKTAGRIIVVDGIYINPSITYDNLEQIIITETLAHCLKHDYTYALYYNIISNINSEKVYETLELQGFQKLNDESIDKTIYAVDMKFPICLTLNLESFIKEPLNLNPNVQEVIKKSRKDLQESFTKLYPGSLVLSFDNDMINQTLIQKVCGINRVPDEVQNPRVLGEYMCVPFGNILKGMVVPNTVTKSLHTEKVFTTDVKHFRILEYPFYSPLKNQIRTIKSFDKPVILVDDLLHKGYRIKEIDPILKSQDVKVEKIIVGIMSGRGKDLMEIQGRNVDSAYFIPNLRIWFNENLMYPFLGGDEIWSEDESNLNLIPSINLILPYVAPPFIKSATNEDIYNLSMTCLVNAKKLLKVLESEYQNMYEKNLTVKRLGEVLVSPRYPFIGKNISYDSNFEASSYMDVSIENLIKLERYIK